MAEESDKWENHVRNFLQDTAAGLLRLLIVWTIICLALAAVGSCSAGETSIAGRILSGLMKAFTG